ncbi:hypothetical protein BaRGS_00004139 [Batillaria attramentaria]|uniref:GPI transamidase component PIG-T n=1 Tax=Batillaria attramentaria TaxID=370345 RepID=A0ABD0LYW6_9CAEN
MADEVCGFPVLFVTVWVLCFSLLTSAVKNDEFHEELYVKPLQNGHVYYHFQFTTKWNVSVHSTSNFQHFRLFPKALGEVLTTYHVQEIHLTQTQGKWRHQAWGYPVEDAPPGAQLWVWFKPTVKDVDKTWADLVNAVSGLFCSSLNFLDAKATVTPRWSFRPRGVTPKGYATNSPFIRYGALPREIVCTENLTPWKKLLPCDSKVGLATLFKAERLHDSDFHSLGLHFRPICADSSCKVEAVELTQTLSLVLDPSLGNNGYQNWSIRKVFGQSLTSQCPLASSSKIFVDTTANRDQVKFSLSPTPSEQLEVRRSSGRIQQLAVYNIGELIATRKVLSVSAQSNDRVEYGVAVSPPVYAHRYITGYGLENGGVSCLIFNTLDKPLHVLYMEMLPWFTRVFYKSLTVETGGKAVPYKTFYVPGRDRERSYHLELSFVLAPNAVTKVSLQFERAFLKWTEYPPDANHGFYINSAVISFQLPTDSATLIPPLNTSTLQQAIVDGSQENFVRLYTEALLVSLPTPDFSMPYNVICLACTVIAIAFGSIHNLTTRSFVLFNPAEKKGLMTRLKGLLKRRKKGDSEAESDSKNEGGKENERAGGVENITDKQNEGDKDGDRPTLRKTKKAET